MPGTYIDPNMAALAQSTRASEKFDKAAAEKGFIEALESKMLPKEMQEQKEWEVAKKVLKELDAGAGHDNILGMTWMYPNTGSRDLSKVFEALDKMDHGTRMAEIAKMLKGGGSPNTRTPLENIWTNMVGPDWRGNAADKRVYFGDYVDPVTGKSYKSYRSWDASPDKLKEHNIIESGPYKYNAYDALRALGLLPSTDDRAAAEAARAQQAQVLREANKNAWDSVLGVPQDMRNNIL